MLVCKSGRRTEQARQQLVSKGFTRLLELLQSCPRRLQTGYAYLRRLPRRWVAWRPLGPTPIRQRAPEGLRRFTRSSRGQTGLQPLSSAINPAQKMVQTQEDACSGVSVFLLSPGPAVTRNLLDFNDVTTDQYGRLYAVYTDGCVSGACIATGNSSTALTPKPRTTGPPSRQAFARLQASVCSRSTTPRH